MGKRYSNRIRVRKRIKLLDMNDDQIEEILKIFDEHTQELKRKKEEMEHRLKTKRSVGLRKISSAIKLTIEHHGPIGIGQIGSAAKRVYGQLKDEKF